MSGDHEKIHDENSRLKNWEKWLQKWKNVQGKISNKLDLKPEELLMNYAEGLVNVSQEKQVLEFAKIPTRFDKYRGKPDFYKLPVSLPRKCRCCDEPTYFAVKTKPERFLVPKVTNVGIPDLVRYEKNILHGARNIYKRWQNSTYRQEKMLQLDEKIQNIVPHWPNFEHLVVIGTKILAEDHKEEELHQVSKTSQHIVEEIIRAPTESFEESPSPKRLNLDINGTVFDEICGEGARKIRLHFEFDIATTEVSVQFLEFVNRGKATIRINWRKLEKFRLFRNYTEEKFEKFGFYFDRKELLILPGETTRLPVWFKTENSGSYSESWEISTLPKMWGENFHVILFLESYSYFSDLKEKVDKIIQHIDIQAKNMLIKDILNDLLNVVQYEDLPVKPCVYGEAELFEIANMFNGRPQFLYNENIIQNLKEIYETLKKGPEQFNYSIDELNKLAHSKDTSLYIENKVAEVAEYILKIESGATERVDVKEKKDEKKKKGGEKSSKKSKSSKSSKKSSKKGGKKSHDVAQAKAVEEIKKEYKTEPFVYTNQSKVWDLVKELDAPIIINTHREKYFLCYNIIVAYFNKMCHLLDSLDSEKGLEMSRKYPLHKCKLIPINEQPERLVYEYYEDHYIPVPPIEDNYPFEAKRRPKTLKDISSDDIESLYTTYFNKSLDVRKDTPKNKKGKKDKSSKNRKGKSKSPKSKKDKKSVKSDKKPKEKIVKKEESVESFNPYVEQFVYVPQIENADSENLPAMRTQDLLPKKCLEDYRYKEYLIIYTCLGNAVDAMVDTLHSFECSVSYSTLIEVKDQALEK